MSAAMVLGAGGASMAAPATAARPAGRLVQQIASVEGVTPQVLRQDLQQGQTLLQIANGKYTDANALATALLAPMKAKLDAEVSAGKLTAARENSMYGKLLSRVTTLVTTPHPVLAFQRAMGRHFFRVSPRQIVRDVAQTCNTTTTALTTALHKGDTSVLAACQATNPAATEAQLTTIIFAPIQSRLNKQVTSGKLTQTREQTMAATIQARIAKMLTATRPAKS